MQAFRTLVAMSFGVGLVIVALIDLGRSNGPWAPATNGREAFATA